MKRILRIAFPAALILVTTAIPAVAQFFLDGNKLYSFCESSPWVVENYTMGVVDSFSQPMIVTDDAGSTITRRVDICIPSAANSKQFVDMVCHYLRDNPADRHWAAYALVYNAVEDSWPCP